MSQKYLILRDDEKINDSPLTFKRRYLVTLWNGDDKLQYHITPEEFLSEIEKLKSRGYVHVN